MLLTTGRFMRPLQHGRKLRTHFLRYLGAAIPLIREQGYHSNLVSRLEREMNNAFLAPTKIKLCDAVHAVCVLDVFDLAVSSFGLRKH